MPQVSSFEAVVGDSCSENQNDEILAELARNGDVRSTEILVNRYWSLVAVCSKSYFLMGADREDVLQEGMIGLFKAVQSFSSDKGVSFKTFAMLCIKRQIISAVKTSSRLKHLPLNSYISLDKEVDGVDTYKHIGYTGERSSSDPEQIVIDKENVTDAHQQLDRLLSDFEARVLVYHLNGEPYGKIAEHLGKEPKSIDNALQRIKRKVLKTLSEKELLS